MRAEKATAGLDNFDPFPELTPYEFEVPVDPVQRITMPTTTQQTTFTTERPRPLPKIIKQEAVADVAADVRANPELAKLPSYREESPSDWMAKYENGRIPAKALTPIGDNHSLRGDAAAAYKAMRRTAKKQGITWGITDSYRDIATQERLAAEKGLYSQGGLAAEPGTSPHGWGIAVDLGLSAEAQAWMNKHAGDFGFKTIPREPWHWEYKGGFKPAYKGKKVKRPRRAAKDPTPTELVAPRSDLVNALLFTDTVNEVRRPKRTKRDFDDLEKGGLGFVPARYRKMFQAAAQKYGLSPRLLAYVAQVESGFNPKAVSSAGAQGMMQIMPLHGLENPLNARVSIFKGAEILASYIQGMGSLRGGLAAYNAGPNNHTAGLGYADKILGLYRG